MHAGKCAIYSSGGSYHQTPIEGPTLINSLHRGKQVHSSLRSLSALWSISNQPYYTC